MDRVKGENWDSGCSIIASLHDVSLGILLSYKLPGNIWYASSLEITVHINISGALLMFWFYTPFIFDEVFMIYDQVRKYEWNCQVI